ncbi:hypothetical protein ACJZ2D_007120 [Fusarium nematophilum]
MKFSLAILAGVATLATANPLQIIVLDDNSHGVESEQVCSPIGGPCKIRGDCCGGNEYQAHCEFTNNGRVCKPGKSCGLRGDGCSYDSECCSGWYCSSGRCYK